MDSLNIILSKDNNNRDINLDCMPIGASESLKEILESFIAIARYEKEKNNIDLSIGVTKGSACPKLIGDDYAMNVVVNNINNVINNAKDRDNFYVSHLNKIRSNVVEKKMAKIVYLKGVEKVDLTNSFEKEFKVKRERKNLDKYFEVEFFKGKLLQIGGQNPNFHLQIGFDTITVDCSEIEAQKIIKFLYNDIYISTWVERNNKGKCVYRFCDYYVTNDATNLYKDFEDFFKKIAPLKGTKPLHEISNYLEIFYENKDFGNATKFLKFFNNKNVNPNFLKVILVLSKNLMSSNIGSENKNYIDTITNLENCLKNILSKGK